MERRQFLEDPDDPLWFLRFAGSDIFHVKYIKLFVKILTIVQAASLVVHICYLLYTFDSNELVKYAPIFLFTNYGLVNVVQVTTVGNFISREGQEYQFKTKTNISAATEARLLQQVTVVNVFTVFNTILAISAGLAFVVPHKDDGEFFLVIKLLRKNSSTFSEILIKIYTLMNIPFIYCMIVSVYQLMYNMLHIKLRMFLLRRHIGDQEDLLTKYSSELIENQEYQKLVQKKLKFCIENYQEVKTIAKNKNIKMRTFVLILSFSGCLHGIGAAVYLYTGIMCGHFARVGITMMLFACTFWAVITAGQLLETESEKMSESLMRMAWYTWNKENKKNLLVFLPNVMESFTIKSTENIRINYNLGVTIVRGIFSVASLFAQLKM